MGKNNIYKLFFLVFAVMVLAGMLVACQIKTELQDEDYVEVTALRTDEASIYMSPLGDASTYQVNVEILPANATNRKLNYHIPSEYLGYVSVNSTGLLTARANTTGFVVPLTVTSTTNEKAFLTINIVVEEVAVKSIKFHQEKVDLLFEGDSAEAWVDYYPSHASDGRTVNYEIVKKEVDEEQNKKIVSIETMENGHVLITPVSVGHVHIKASAVTTDQEKSEAFLAVTVSYLQGQYQLTVSGTPQWTQTIGDFSAINFTLRVLGDHIDRNPAIKWWKGPYGAGDKGKHINGQDDEMQYTYVPDDTTPIAYCIYASITSYGRENDPVWLYSDEITVYEAFVGFKLNYQNLSSVYTPYQYGDEAAFRLLESSSANTASYDWYLQKMNGDGNEFFIASTPVSDRDLVRRMNVVGDYQMIVRSKSSDGTYLKQDLFTFSSERLVVGDTLSVIPDVIGSGLPPDSYHWYYLPCNANGDYDLSQKREIKSTAKGEMFYYPLLTAGYFRLLVTSTTNGVLSTVTQNGEKTAYNHVGELIRVYAPEELLSAESNDLVDFSVLGSHEFAASINSRVEGVVIEGSQYMGENLLYVHWSPCAGVNRYEVEMIFEDKSMVILDSAENVAVFGDNYFYIPSSVAGFDDKFSLRIKQKDGLYSEYYYYGIANSQGAGDANHILKIDDDKTPYFANVANNINGYVTTLDELYDLVEYVLLYKPSTNSLIRKGSDTIDGVFYDTFTITFFTTLTYTTEMMNVFDVIPPDDITSDIYDVYHLVCGVQQQGPYLSDFLIKEIFAKEDGGYAVTFATPNKGNTQVRYETPASVTKNAEVSSAFYSVDPYKMIDITYPIDNATGIAVYTSDELCYVMERGYRPVPTGSDDLAELYKQVKTIYSSLIDETMSDLEKLLAFYDWLCYSVAYDDSTEALSATKTRLEIDNFDSCHLEGVFALKNVNSRHALPQGYAKAFSALCGLAGIPCRSYTAKTNSYRVYNKVYVMDAWYTVDVGYGVTKTANGGRPDHTCFLMTDNEYSLYCKQRDGISPDMYGIFPISEKSFDLYTDCTVRGYSLYVNTLQKLEELLNAATGTGVVALEFECSSDVAVSIADLRSKCNRIILSTGKIAGEFIDVSGEGTNLRAIVYLYDPQ
ncbi:MAG: hypothetical protein J5781_06745 [Clostridia bacterium]|nr:hypothetical protein [Clostridia bacterium]